jgi:hypothetical protein
MRNFSRSQRVDVDGVVADRTAIVGVAIIAP